MPISKHYCESIIEPGGAFLEVSVAGVGQSEEGGVGPKWRVLEKKEKKSHFVKSRNKIYLVRATVLVVLQK